jgi:hypothetical protein
MSLNNHIVDIYRGQFAIDSFDGVVDFMNCYENVHGVDRVLGAFRSLVSLFEDQYAWANFYQGEQERKSAWYVAELERVNSLLEAEKSAKIVKPKRKKED